MDFRSILMKATALLLYAGSFQAAAITIDADDYPVGMDITHVAPGATLNHYTHQAYSDSISYGPAITILADQQLKTLDESFDNIYYLGYLGWGEPLSELPGFAGLSITFDQAVRSLNITAFNAYGDGLFAFLFDKNDNFLGHIEASTKYHSPGCDTSQLSCARHTIHENLSGESVYRVAIGSDSTSTYLTRIRFSVPEPSSLALLSLGLLAMGASILRGTRHAHDR